MKKKDSPARTQMIELLGGDQIAVRITNTLECEGIRTLEDFRSTTMTEFRDMRWMGPKSLERIRMTRNHLYNRRIAPQGATYSAVDDYVQVEKVVEGICDKLGTMGSVPGYGTEGALRVALGCLFSLGKVVGRRTAYGEGNQITDLQADPLIVSWLRVVNETEAT